MLKPALLSAAFVGLVAASWSACSHGPGIGGTSDGGVYDFAGASPNLDASSCTGMSAECMKDADCDDGNPETVDTCELGTGEFPVGTCLHAACDGGTSCVSQAVDPTCLQPDLGDVYPPFVTLYAPDVPADCANGFELTDTKATLEYTIYATSAGGSRGLTLDLDIATYEQSDGVEITGVDGACKKYTLFDTCHLKTADKAESAYTTGLARPADASIRQYHLDLRPGTSQLTFDFGNVVSPMYIQVLGLCDFTLDAPSSKSEKWYSPVPM